MLVLVLVAVLTMLGMGVMRKKVRTLSKIINDFIS
jgi:hypothetical protein